VPFRNSTGNLYINRKCTGATVASHPLAASICLGPFEVWPGRITCICLLRAKPQARNYRGREVPLNRKDTSP
jgi:hypothetical protein